MCSGCTTGRAEAFEPCAEEPPSTAHRAAPGLDCWIGVGTDRHPWSAEIRVPIQGRHPRRHTPNRRPLTAPAAATAVAATEVAAGTPAEAAAGTSAEAAAPPTAVEAARTANRAAVAAGAGLH
jgi:hypothetical protein